MDTIQFQMGNKVSASHRMTRQRLGTLDVGRWKLDNFHFCS